MVGSSPRAPRQGRDSGPDPDLAQTEVFAETRGQEKLTALLTATLMIVDGRDGVGD
jgi:hypothetical protein